MKMPPQRPRTAEGMSRPARHGSGRHSVAPGRPSGQRVLLADSREAGLTARSLDDLDCARCRRSGNRRSGPVAPLRGVYLPPPQRGGSRSRPWSSTRFIKLSRGWRADMGPNGQRVAAGPRRRRGSRCRRVAARPRLSPSASASCRDAPSPIRRLAHRGDRAGLGKACAVGLIARLCSRRACSVVKG